MAKAKRSPAKGEQNPKETPPIVTEKVTTDTATTEHIKMELPETVEASKPVTLAGRVSNKYIPNSVGKVRLVKKSTGKIIAMAVDLSIARTAMKNNPDIEILND